MQVALVTRFGAPEVLVPSEAPDPVAGPGEVAIDVAAADVLWVETMIRQGSGGEHFDVTPPYVPGNAVAGRVRAVGDGVDRGWIGREVVTHTGERGGYAEQVVVPADRFSVVPEGLGLREAAALLHDGPTALALFEGTQIGSGDRVLVVGASGGLGIVSVQLARARGARVVAVARDERKLARIRQLGANAVIDSETPDWVEQAREALGGEGADVILDNVGGRAGEAAFAVIAPGGRFSAHGTPSGAFAAIDSAQAARRGVIVRGIGDVQLTDAVRKRLTEQALAEAASGRIEPVIGQTFPLEQAAAAHSAIEGRTVFGKTLLLPDPHSSPAGRSLPPVGTITRPAPNDEWEIGRLDLDAYLERIAYGGALASDAGTLRGLHRAHAAAIPFENLDVVLGRSIELDLDSVQDKLVRRLRGGYCFEHNLLFAAVLERIGYAVTRLAARVQPAHPGPRTHMLMHVVADDRPWLADVGFGASLLEPLPLEATIARQGGWTYRLDAADSGAWLLRAERPEGWSDLYAFTLEPQRPIDYAVYNHYTATHPRSPFVGRLVVLRTEPYIQHALRGHDLTAIRPGIATKTRQLDGEELPGVLAGTFGISLDAEEAAGLRRATRDQSPSGRSPTQ